MAEFDPSSTAAYQPVRAPRGNALSCLGWQQEAALRMLMNSVDPEVAEHPEELIPSGGTGRVARDWESFQGIVEALRKLRDDETLRVRAGAVAGVSRTHVDAARVSISGADWSYVGTQGALPAAYELFWCAARKHFGGALAGKLVVSSGMDGMGGALALAATANGAAFLGIDVDAERIKRRVKTGYCDLLVNSLDEALRILKNAVRKREPTSVGLIGNCADVIPELARRGVVPDLLTDQTPADDPAGGYVPQGLTVEQARELRRSNPETARERALDAIAAQVRGILDLRKLGAVSFEYGNQLRAAAHARGVQNAYDISDGVEEYLRPSLRAGRAPLLWVALSGEARDVLRADRLALELFPDDDSLRRWMQLAQRLPRFLGLPARGCWLEGAARAGFGLKLNDLVARGEVAGPMAIVGDFAGVAPANAGSLLPEETGAAWICAGRTSADNARWGVVADGTPEARERIARVMSPVRRNG